MRTRKKTQADSAEQRIGMRKKTKTKTLGALAELSRNLMMRMLQVLIDSDDDEASGSGF